MRIEIFDVGHGQCAVVTSPNGRRMMLDCGVRVRNDRFWSPSLHYLGQLFDLLALLNLDEDHIKNFGFMLRETTIGQILSNPTIGARELRLLKKDGMGPGTHALLGWMDNPHTGVPTPLPHFGPLRIWWYYNSFIRGLTTKTNDLSLIVFLEYSGFKIIFSGDMETSGWQQALLNPCFCRDLIGTNIFVASHHGRESGQCAELFNWLQPEIILISDEERRYDSQDTNQWYAERCRGAIVLAEPRRRRYVMTTRRDGSMQIDVFQNGAWILRPMHVQDWPLTPPQRSRTTPGLGLLAEPGLKSPFAGSELGLLNPFLQRNF